MYYENLVGRENWIDLGIFFTSILQIVAMIDGKIDRKEEEALNAISEKEDFNNPITNELMRFLRANFLEISKRSLDLAHNNDELKLVEKIEETLKKLEEKVGKERVKEFKTEMMALAIYIASVSGKSFFKRNPISKEEDRVLSTYFDFLKITPEDIENFINKYY